MKEKFSNNSVYDTIIRLLIILLIITWCFMILLPFGNILLWTLILAIAMYPYHEKITKKFGGKPKLVSFLIVLSAFVIIFIPSWFLTNSLIEEVKIVKTSFDNEAFSIPPPSEQVKEWPLIGARVYDFWQDVSSNMEETIIKYQDQLKDIGKKLAKGILNSISAGFQILISFVLAAVLLVFGGIGEAIRKFFRKLAGNRGDEFADVTKDTINSVVKGVIGVASLMAVLYGIVFLLAGIPYAGILVLIIFVLAIFQVTGLIVALPVIFYLFAVRETVPAIVWTVIILVVGTADNIIRPYLLGKGAPVPMPVIFMGVIGGFMLSGFIGLFTGAIVMSLGYKLFTGWVNSNEGVK